MSNHITNLHIENFKSIKSLDLKCKRINVFIGKPNVGKSNILEALSLYIPYPKNSSYLQDTVRFEKLSNLFYDQNRQNPIKIETGFDLLTFQENNDNYLLNNSNGSTQSSYIIRNDGHLSSAGTPFYLTNVKKYEFKKKGKIHEAFDKYLLPPFGDNLYTIVEENKELREEVASFFPDYGLEFVLVLGENKFLVQKKIGMYAFQTPYTLIADTLQRIIFYLAAIESNSDSILLFEEPEAHSFPPYVTMLTDRIIHSTSNQFFIATHSPYILNELLSHSSFEETAIFLTDYKDYQTVARELSEKEIETVVTNGINIFSNLELFSDASI